MTDLPKATRLKDALGKGLLIGAWAVLAPAAAMALSYTGGANQFAGGFQPSNAPWGGFGGGSCSATRTPVIFFHGNGDEAKNFDFPSSTGVPSAYDALRAGGYNDCELFGLNWLSPGERSTPQLNYHQPSKATLMAEFIDDVLAYTGATQVDVIAHSFGVTMSLETLERSNRWGSLRRFIAISGGLRGLTSCWSVGAANPAVPTCGSQNVFNSNIFGFYPHGFWSYNPRMANGGFRDDPSGKSARFYALGADIHDQILCGSASTVVGCGDSAYFDSRSNVRAQLDVGYGTPAAGLDFDLDDWSPFNLAGGDADGVGHFRAKNNTGRIQLNMLTTSCSGTACCAGYGDTCGP